MIYTIHQRQVLPISRKEAWSFFSRPENLAEITPPDVGFQIMHNHGDGTFQGKIISYKIKVFPFITMTWVTEITSVRDGHNFVDDQRIGPYALWHHQHHFHDHPDGIEMEDLVHYTLPFGWFGQIAHMFFVKNKLKQIFEFRRVAIAQKFLSAS